MWGESTGSQLVPRVRRNGPVRVRVAAAGNCWRPSTAGPDRGDGRTESNRRSQPRPPYAARLDQGLAVGAIAGRVAPNCPSLSPGAAGVLRVAGLADPRPPAGRGPGARVCLRWSRPGRSTGCQTYCPEHSRRSARVRRFRAAAPVRGRALRRGPEAFSATSPRCPAGPNLESSKR